MNSNFPEDPQASDPIDHFTDGSFAQHPSPGGWLTSSPLPQAAPPPPVARPFDFRPLTAGEILDRTFAVYRSRFWLFAGIGGIAGAARTLLTAAQMLSGHFARPVTLANRFDIAGITLSFVTAVVSFFFVNLGLAASTYAVGELYLGRNVSVGSSWKSVRPRWLGYTGIFLWQVGSFIWIPLLTFVPGFIVILVARRAVGGNVAMIGIAAIVMVLGGIGGAIGGTILLIRNLLAAPAAVVEGLKVRDSMRRSKYLAMGAKGRIFLVGVIYYCLMMIVGVAQAPFAVFMLLAIQKGHEAIGSQIATLLIGFVGSSLVMPIFMIGLTIIYFDQRTRKEAFDIAMMLDPLPAPTPSAPMTPVTPVEVIATEPTTNHIPEA